MSAGRSSTTLVIKTSIATTDMIERGYHLERFVDVLLTQIAPREHQGCLYDISTHKLICYRKEPRT